MIYIKAIGAFMLVFGSMYLGGKVKFHEAIIISVALIIGSLLSMGV